MTATRSAIANASPWSWVTKTAVVPVLRSTAPRSASSRSRSDRSSAASGSSSNSSRGRGASARARATRCASPPDSVATRRGAVAGQSDQLEQIADPGVGSRLPVSPARRSP